MEPVDALRGPPVGGGKLLAMPRGRRRVRACLASGFILFLLMVVSSARAAPAGMSSSTTDPVAAAGLSPTLSLDTSVSPMVICAQQSVACPAATGTARVQLSVSAQGGPIPYWPAVQVAFVIETTAYDGVFGTDRPTSFDACANANPTAPACEESNGIPFFVANAQEIANAIQASNPRSSVSFALVDYYDARGEPWDDADGPEYNVDIGSFVPANQFGGLVVSTFQQSVMNGLWYSWDQDLDNAFLDTSSITALYGALVGSELDWSNNTHHVVVWMGSSAPRDPSYPEDYCVSSSSYNSEPTPPPCMSESCEPSYIFPAGASPECEGWVNSQDGNPKDSIAALAHDTPECTASIGGVCTVDMIDLWTTPTDPYSEGWPDASQFTKIGGGPGGTAGTRERRAHRSGRVRPRGRHRRDMVRPCLRVVSQRRARGPPVRPFRRFDRHTEHRKSDALQRISFDRLRTRLWD